MCAVKNVIEKECQITTDTEKEKNYNLRLSQNIEAIKIISYYPYIKYDN